MRYNKYKVQFRFLLTISLFWFSDNLIAQIVKIKSTYELIEQKCVFCNKSSIYLSMGSVSKALNYPRANQDFLTRYIWPSSESAARFYSRYALKNHLVNCDVCRDDNIKDGWGNINRCYSVENGRTDKKHDLVTHYSNFDVDIEVSKTEIDVIINRLIQIQDSVRIENINKEKLKLIKKTEDSLKRIEVSRRQIEAERIETLRLQELENSRILLKANITAQANFCDSLYQTGKATQDYSSRFIAASKVFDNLGKKIMDYNSFYGASFYITFYLFEHMLQMAFVANDLAFIDKYIGVYNDLESLRVRWIKNDEPQFGYNIKFYTFMRNFLTSNYTGITKSDIKKKIYLCGRFDSNVPVPYFGYVSVTGWFSTYSDLKYSGLVEDRQHLIDVFKFLKTSETYKELFAKNNTLAAINVALEILEPKK